MKFSLALLVLLTACAQLPRAFEKERKGIRHTASRALYPRVVGNYSFLNHDHSEALAAVDEDGGRSTAVYLDYKSGGQDTSILYRPFAKVETYQKPKKLKFEEFVKAEVKKLTQDREVTQDTWSKTARGFRYRQVKITGSQPFLSQGFTGVGFHERLPAITKLVFLDRGDHILFMTTSYPVNEAETLAVPNSEFVNKFLEVQK